MSLRGRLIGYLRADLPTDEISPYSRAGTDVYDLIDQTPPASWARLAAWNALIIQMYADELVEADTNSGYVDATTGTFAKSLYAMVGVWLTYSKQAQANPAYSFDFRLPCPLPNWHTPYRTDDQLRGMRATLESARTRVAADLEAFAGDEAAKGTLRGRLAAVDSTISQIEGLWTRDPDDALRGTIGDTLLRALDGANELGQLLARPDLIPRY